MPTVTPTHATIWTGDSGLRRRLRARLYQMVSYAEFLAEDSRTQADSRFATSLDEVIAAIDACLQAISRQLPQYGPDGEALESRDNREQLITLHADLTTRLGKLREVGEGEALINLQPDLNKLHAAARAYQEAVEEKDAESVVAPATKPGDGPAIANSSTAQPAARAIALRGLLLVVDDNEGNREVLSRRLLRDGCEVLLAETGRQALRMVQRYDFSLVLLDIMMPEMDGYSVLSELKRNPATKKIPVIMISAVDEIESVVRCIQLGADDYLYKPFNPVLLRARVGALLERNRLRREEDDRTAELTLALEQLREQRKKSDELLRNILPASIAEELQSRGAVAPQYYEDVTIVFADFVAFTSLTEDLPAEDLVHVLNRYFTAFDEIVLRHKLEKLKTIGDSYMFAGGMPARSRSHPVDSVLAAMEMIRATQEMAKTGPVSWQLRIGIHTGPVAAGVVGMHKFAFDVWGDTVNLSSRMEASGAADRVNVSSTTYSRVKDFFSFEKRGLVTIKGGRDVQMYFVKGVATGVLDRQMTSAAVFLQRYRTYFQKDVAGSEYLFADTVATAS